VLLAVIAIVLLLGHDIAASGAMLTGTIQLVAERHKRVTEKAKHVGFSAIAPGAPCITNSRL
jgi:hypothetical protein